MNKARRGGGLTWTRCYPDTPLTNDDVTVDPDGDHEQHKLETRNFKQNSFDICTTQLQRLSLL